MTTPNELNKFLRERDFDTELFYVSDKVSTLVVRKHDRKASVGVHFLEDDTIKLVSRIGYENVADVHFPAAPPPIVLFNNPNLSLGTELILLMARLYDLENLSRQIYEQRVGPKEDTRMVIARKIAELGLPNLTVDNLSRRFEAYGEKVNLYGAILDDGRVEINAEGPANVMITVLQEIFGKQQP